uniref:Uncharacterized protein n=1 Tax=Arundo donax TaxID=35708 RepID=A0A0A9C0Q1_ARUDO
MDRGGWLADDGGGRWAGCMESCGALPAMVMEDCRWAVEVDGALHVCCD